MRRYRDELYDLRSGWRRDIERILETAKDPAVNSWWNHQILKLGFKWSPERLAIDFFEDKVRASRERELFEHLVPLADVVRCIRVAFLIDVCIAQWCGSLDLLFSNTLRNEAELWEGIVQRIDELAETFQDKESTSRIHTITSIGEAIRAYVVALAGQVEYQTEEIPA